MAIDVGSMVVAGDAGAFDGSVPAPYGWVAASPGAGTWNVLWSNGAYTTAVATAELTELDYTFKVSDLLGRRVRPSAAVDPSRIGVVVLQTGTDKLIVESPSGTYAISKSSIVEVN